MPFTKCHKIGVGRIPWNKGLTKETDGRMRKKASAQIGKIHRGTFKKGHIVNDEIRNKIRLANTGKKQSQETIEKRVNKLRGRSRPPLSKEWKEKLSKSHKGKKYPKELYPNYGTRGKKLSEEEKKQKSEMMKRLFQEGKIKPFFKKGDKHLRETKKKISETMKKLYNEGKIKNIGLKREKNYNWNDGTSFEPYGFDFNKRFKERIKERDNRCCVVCNIVEEKLNSLLHIHHIDYIKTNSFPQNCVSLCRGCHCKTNYNRQHWKIFFQSLLKERYGYEYTQDQKIILDFMEV